MKTGSSLLKATLALLAVSPLQAVAQVSVTGWLTASSGFKIRLPNTSEDVICAGKVKTLGIDSNGMVSVKTDLHRNPVYICSMDIKHGWVAPTTCTAWYALLERARTAGTPVKIRYLELHVPDAERATIREAKSAATLQCPAPDTIAVQNGWSQTSYHTSPYSIEVGK